MLSTGIRSTRLTMRLRGSACAQPKTPPLTARHSSREDASIAPLSVHSSVFQCNAATAPAGDRLRPRSNLRTTDRCSFATAMQPASLSLRSRNEQAFDEGGLMRNRKVTRLAPLALLSAAGPRRVRRARVRRRILDRRQDPLVRGRHCARREPRHGHRHRSHNRSRHRPPRRRRRGQLQPVRPLKRLLRDQHREVRQPAQLPGQPRDVLGRRHGNRADTDRPRHRDRRLQGHQRHGPDHGHVRVDPATTGQRPLQHERDPVPGHRARTRGRNRLLQIDREGDRWSVWD